MLGHVNCLKLASGVLGLSLITVALGAAAAAATPCPAAVRQSAATALSSGTVVGTVLGTDGKALAGICVTAIPANEGQAIGAAAVTSRAGMYALAGLRAGRYELRYRSCASPAGLGGSLASPASRPASMATGQRLVH